MAVWAILHSPTRVRVCLTTDEQSPGSPTRRASVEAGLELAVDVTGLILNWGAFTYPVLKLDNTLREATLNESYDCGQNDTEVRSRQRLRILDAKNKTITMLADVTVPQTVKDAMEAVVKAMRIDQVT